MAKRPPASEPINEKIVDVDVASEMQGSFLEYAYSVIYSRALPDARDGLKPVQRRILYTMAQMGLRPDRGHVKSARVVGEVMGRLHPHGDGAIYDAMVRMAQPFSFRLPLVDGHGNFGSLDDGPAAYRYTEARLAASAMKMTESLDEDVVDFAPNYDGREQEPEVLPAAIPALLVNGASGIAVGMATNLPPHNLGEVVAACRYLLKNPKATVAELMKYLPGPDLPTGGVILGLDGIRDAYVEGRGSFKMRATVSVENVTARRQALVVTELPYNVGPEKLIEKIKDGVTAKKITGISDIIDLSDGDRGLRIVIELKSGFNPQAVLQQLYKLTPLEDQFSINAVALVDGAPQTLGLVDLLAVFLKHRISVVRRRTEFRRMKAQERLHLVAGLLIAIIDIDEVIQVIRSSDDTSAARERLMKAFDLSEIQTNYILEMPLRRLTKFSRIELEKESEQLQAEIAELTRILEEPKAVEALVSDELADVAKEFATPRRTVLQESDGTSMVSTDLEIADDPCVVMLSSSGLLARLPEGTVANLGGRTKHDVVVSTTQATARGEIGLVTSFGRIHKLSVVEIAALAANETALSLKGGSALKEFVILDKKEVPLALVPLTEEAVLALGTLRGVIKRVTLDIPKGDVFDVIRLEDGDSVVGAGVTTNEDQHLVFITTDGQLLHFDASLVRPQGRGAGGMAGINLSKDASVLAFMVASPTDDVLTVAGSTTALPGTDPGTFKVTPLSEYPTKGRATGGVRCHTLRKSENALLFAAVGQAPLRAAAAGGANVDLSFEYSKRDATGTALSSNIVAVAGRMGA